ncbi:glycosyltransferase [Erysipelothrix sp. HDW6C]|uniref:glycosyltransferase n=1 Tax=Erysipelothrix sp. HDW6C TaxID=2714930 RepID=UPI00140CF174|nr:glycosyltransferase [Erysipelothrix sp. HDW6C]QIK70036.1 glycosyltransferase [Erysipelothrix sp. HDW6C]
MKRVAHILSSGGYSGAENIAIRFIEATPESYESVYVSTAGPIEVKLSDANIRHYCIPNNSHSTLKKAIKDLDVDIVYAHDFKASVRTAFLMSPVTKISHIHQNPSWFSSINIKTLLFLFCSLFLSKIVFVSQETRDEFAFAGAIKKKSVVLDNFVDGVIVKERAGHQNKKFHVSFLGRFEPVKDPLRFLKLINTIKPDYPNISAIMIGDGSLIHSARQYVVEQGLESNVEIVGYQDNPYTYLSESFINVIPSVWEGFGLSAVEAMVLGVPVVANSVGGLKTVVTEECGFLCKNDEDFVSAITTLINEKSKLAEYSKNALENSKKYTDRDRWGHGVAGILSQE